MLLGLVLLLLGAGRAPAFEITQPIPGSNQTACANVRGAATASGTAVDAYPCGAAINEKWQLAGMTMTGIGTEGGSTTCLAQASTALHNAPVVLSTNCAINPNSNWTLSGSQIIASGIDGGCLDSRGKYGPLAQLVLNPCSTTGQASQNWVVTDIVITQAVPNTNESVCVDVRGNSIANKTAVDAYPCKLGFNDRWTYVKGQLQGIGTTKNHPTCLGEGQFSVVELETCNGSSTQQWMVQINFGTGSGYIVRNIGTGLCLDSGGNFGDVQMLDTGCNFTVFASQSWALH
jgi:hypothetical protein